MIWINTNAYTYSFPVYYYNENQEGKLLGRVNLEDFAPVICEYCRSNDTYEVVLNGNSSHLEKIKQDIQKTNKLKYSDNKEIEVKINEISN
jgi:hypothetical protein